jgi:hypothetical protein
MTITAKAAADHLRVWQSKGRQYEEAARILDQTEVTGEAPGDVCTIQVLDYVTGKWLTISAPSGAPRRWKLAAAYKFVRRDLGWADGPVRVALAAA